MSAHHRGGTGRAEQWYSAFHRDFDLPPARRTGWRKSLAHQQLAPMIDADWCWFDGPQVVALLDTKLAGERWTLAGPLGNGLKAMAKLAGDAGVPAFVLTIAIEHSRFRFHALNGPASAALLAMETWATTSPNGAACPPLEPDHEHGDLLTLTVQQRGYWHFEMLTRARARGEERHDEAETERRVRVLYDAVPLPQQPAHAVALELFRYGPNALAQRLRGATEPCPPVQSLAATALELAAANPRLFQRLRAAGHDVTAYLENAARVAAALERDAAADTETMLEVPAHDEAPQPDIMPPEFGLVMGLHHAARRVAGLQAAADRSRELVAMLAA